MNDVNLANGQKFIYTVLPDFKPVRLVDIYYNEELMPDETEAGDTLTCILGFTNPYPDTLTIGEDNTQLLLLLADKKQRRAVPIDLHLTLPPSNPDETITLMTRIKAGIPADLPESGYDMGFAISRAPLGFWYNSPRHRIEILSGK